MRKVIKQLVEKHCVNVKFANVWEMIDANKVWKWQDDGLVAISTATSDPILAKLAYDNGCSEGQYILVDRVTGDIRLS